MWGFILSLLLTCQIQFGIVNPADPKEPAPYGLVETYVDTISVAVISRDGYAVLFFWDMLQGDWQLLDYQYFNNDVLWHTYNEDGYHIFFKDDSSSCYRLVHAKAYVMTEEEVNPLHQNIQKAWFNQRINPGLGGVKR